MTLIRQTYTLLRQNPLLSTISILGTAFAITMIMAIVIVWQTKYSNLSPEVNRDRCLYITALHLQGKPNKTNNSNSMCSASFMKACVMPVKSIEACTAYSPVSAALISLSDGSNRIKVDAVQTDPGFWKVFQFDFIDGLGFTEGDRNDKVKAMVITASMARKLFGNTEVVGQHILYNREEVRITGVVKDVSLTAKDAYGQIWIMYPSSEYTVKNSWNFLGGKNIAILARNKNDFPLIKRGIEKQLKDLNATLSDAELDIMEQPDEIVAHVNHIWSNIGPDMAMIYLQYAIALGVILLVPSLNLCGLSNSRMQQRLSELGVRKAFGATRKALIRQILNENMVLNLLGGILGLLLSYVAVYALRTWLFTNNSNIGTSGDFSLSMDALFSPVVFLLAFLFCFIINLLSAGLPAWLATRRPIVDSLNDK
ncbi:FtsX-like permease family protein [Bacteroidaceae bacterium HV4-6-C5C]|nr:FtsX-like permease family protein [Bacteroidaceae bacterium HV4-6-C5C]